jgi:hypothetical protein
MKLLKLFIPFFLFANFSNAQDTLRDVSPGVIYVKKPQITPYLKVNYKLYLSKVSTVAKEVPVNNGIPGYVEVDRDYPIYDSSKYLENTNRFYPQETVLLSRHFAESMLFTYQPSDTPRIDTIRFVMWIKSNGKVKRVDVDLDSSHIAKMPGELVKEVSSIAYGITEWGKGGGYMTPKKFLKPSQLVPEDYCAEIFIIVSSMPLTEEQKMTGKSYAPFDYPLNCPPADNEQQNSIDKNIGSVPGK